jgi:hypothetical protein
MLSHVKIIDSAPADPYHESKKRARYSSCAVEGTIKVSYFPDGLGSREITTTVSTIGTRLSMDGVPVTEIIMKTCVQKGFEGIFIKDSKSETHGVIKLDQFFKLVGFDHPITKKLRIVVVE